MLSFEDIEDCFPDGAVSLPDGWTGVTTQWLHDFAKVIEAAVLPEGCHRSHPHEDMNEECQRKTVEAMVANLAAQAEKQEPVAWMWKFTGDDGAAFCTKEPTLSIKDGVDYVPLYTRPQPENPLWQATAKSLGAEVDNLTAEVERLKGMVSEIQAARFVMNQHDQHVKRIAELEAENIAFACGLRGKHSTTGATYEHMRQQIATLTDALEKAQKVLDECRGNINPERGYADELEQNVMEAIVTIDEVLGK